MKCDKNYITLWLISTPVVQAISLSGSACTTGSPNAKQFGFRSFMCHTLTQRECFSSWRWAFHILFLMFYENITINILMICLSRLMYIFLSTNLLLLLLLLFVVCVGQQCFGFVRNQYENFETKKRAIFLR